MLIEHGIPWLGKKAVEAGRYYASEALRNPKLQKKAIDYALEKAAPLVQKAGSEALDQFQQRFDLIKNTKPTEKIWTSWVPVYWIQYWNNLELQEKLHQSRWMLLVN